MPLGGTDDETSPRFFPLGGQPEPDPEWEERVRSAARVEHLERPREIVLTWDAAVQLADALLFYIRSWSHEEAGAVPGVPTRELILDRGHRAAEAERVLPGDVVSTAAFLMEQCEEQS